jgi:dTDP-4-dehydrorhamnose reductase
MKLLLLGKTGQLGNEISVQAKEFGFEIIAFGREDVDITDHKKVNLLIIKHKPDVVINASAYHVVPECEANPEKAFAVNTLAVKNLADICNTNNIKLVHYSSDYVFDGLKGKPYKEDDRTYPLQVYGISKLAGEFAVLDYSQQNLVIRACYVYSGKSGSRAKKGNFVLTILKQIEGKTELEVASEQIVSPTYAYDLAKATLQLLKKKKSNGLYHLVNEGHCTLAEFAQQIAVYKKQKIKIIPVDRGGMAGSLRRPLFSALKNTRAKKLGVVLPKWQDGLRRYLSIV